MKLRLLILSLICTAAFSCGKETVEKNGDSVKSQIGFSTQLTKGATTTGPAVLAGSGGFNVWAYSHSAVWNSASDKSAIIDGVNVTGTVVGGDNVSWSYSNPVDWPVNKYVSFFAYGPASSGVISGVTAEGVPVMNFTVNANVKDQQDLLVANPVYNQTGPMYSYANPVTLMFSHALSRIVFSGMIMDQTDTRAIKVKKIVINGIYSKASRTLASPAEWDVDESVIANYTLQISGAEGELQDVTLAADPNPKDITSDNGYLFLLPQKIARESADPTMDVTLEIDGVEVTYSSVLFSPDEWFPGKSYNYQLIVDGNDLKIIMVDTDIELDDWNISIMIQPVPLGLDSLKNHNRINSALKALVHLNIEGGAGNIQSLVDSCDYYAIYLKDNINHDITINMDSAVYLNGFTEGETVIFDAKKIVNEWGSDEVSGDNYTFRILFDDANWAIQNAAQPYDPLNPTVPTLDAVTYATTKNDTVSLPNMNDPSGYIQNKGSIILKRK